MFQAKTEDQHIIDAQQIHNGSRKDRVRSGHQSVSAKLKAFGSLSGNRYGWGSEQGAEGFPGE